MGQEFTNNLILLMGEPFEAKPHDIDPDDGTSLLETLETAPAEEASVGTPP